MKHWCHPAPQGWPSAEVHSRSGFPSAAAFARAGGRALYVSGEEAVAQVEHRDWDASVKALVAFPELLQRMDRDLSWTRDLGDPSAAAAAVSNGRLILKGRKHLYAIGTPTP